MRKILFVLIGVSWLFVCCSDAKKDSKEPFREYDIKGKLYESKNILATFPDIMTMDSLVIVYSSMPNKAGKFITVYNPHEEMKEVGDYGLRGRGPTELLSMNLNSVHGNRMFARNTNMNELVVLEATNSSGRIEITEIERLKTERILHEDNIKREDQNISYLDDDHFVAVSYGGPGKFFSLYDDRMNWLAHFGDGPVTEELDAMSARSKLGGHFATKDGAIVFASATIPKVLYYTKSGDLPQKVWEDTFYDSYYRVENRQIELDASKTVGVVRGIELGEKYVYVLFLDAKWGDYYGGKVSAGNIVFVFDHEGNRIARLDLEYPLQDIAVSEDEKILYGIAETPEYLLASYELPEFGK